MKANQQTELAARIQAACDSTEPFTKDRMKALKAVKWTLKIAGISNDVYALEYRSMDQKEYLTSDKSKAVVFDGRDNQDAKLAYWSAMIGEQFEICLL